MKKLFLISLVILFILLFSLTSVFADKPIVLSLGNVVPPTSDKNRSCIKFAELVQERTNNMIRVDVFPASQLGNENQIANSVKMGAIDIAFVAAEVYDSYVPELAIFVSPLLLTTDEKWDAVMWSPIVDRMADKLLEVAGIRILGRLWMDQRFLVTTNKPVYTLEDLKGLKIRVPGYSGYVASLESLGASPTPIAYSEVYMALQQGIVDGLEHPTGLIRSNKFYEVCHYLTKVPIINTLNILVINESSFQKLTPEQQEILIQAGKEAGIYLKEIILKEREENLKFFEDYGMKIIEVESLKPWFDKIKDYPDKYNYIWGGDVDLYYQIFNFKY